MPHYFAIADGIRHDLAGDLTLQQATQIAEGKLGMTQYRLVEHAVYWASAEGIADATQNARTLAKQRIRQHASGLIAAIDPVLATNAELLRLIWPMLDKSNTPSEITRMRAINQYARQVIQNADLATYDPAADPNWPI